MGGVGSGLIHPVVDVGAVGNNTVSYVSLGSMVVSLHGMLTKDPIVPVGKFYGEAFVNSAVVDALLEETVSTFLFDCDVARMGSSNNRISADCGYSDPADPLMTELFSSNGECYIVKDDHQHKMSCNFHYVFDLDEPTTFQTMGVTGSLTELAGVTSLVAPVSFTALY